MEKRPRPATARIDPNEGDLRGEPRSFSRAPTLLASPEAEFIQGQVMFVNGGANLSA